jgi:hypothetical protein
MAGATKMAGAMPWHAGMPKLKKSMAYAICLFFSFLRFILGFFVRRGLKRVKIKMKK